MVKTLTQVNILHSTFHVSYRSSKGKIEQTLHIGNHSTEIQPSGPFPGAYPSTFAPGASSSGADPPSSREVLHPLGQHLPHLDHLPHVGERVPKGRKASWIILLKVFLLASICVARTPRRSVSIEDTWMRNSLSWRKDKRKSWPKLIFLTLQFVILETFLLLQGSTIHEMTMCLKRTPLRMLS